MDEKTRIQIKEMKKQTIGVEIEMSGITRQKAIKVVAKYYGTTQTVRYDGGSYYTWSCQDGLGRTWKVTRDTSIVANIDDEKAELVTPILTYDDIEDLQEIARQLRRSGAISNPNHYCGVHVHIGANGHTAQTLRNLANIMASHENLIVKALNISQSRINQYCSTVNQTFIQNLNRVKPRTMATLAEVWYVSNGGSRYRDMHYNDSRYHMLNLHATFTKGTIEFRLFQFDNPSAERKGGIHAGQLKSYIQFCLALSQMAKTVRSASPKPQQNDNPKYAMRTWLLRLGFIGSEFETARNILTKRLDGDGAFRHGRTV
jgi:hypothetical protein|nr:MAG TPA: Putative amidoligase enzyme [Caudoviricetes sp.]